MKKLLFAAALLAACPMPAAAAVVFNVVDLGTVGGTYSVGWGHQRCGPGDGGGDVDFHAFLYSGGTARDLNDQLDPPSGWVLFVVTEGWLLFAATDINNRGQITGTGIFNAFRGGMP